MARKTKRCPKRKTARNTWIAFFLTALVLLSAFFTFAPYMNLPFDVPTWRAIFTFANLREDSQAAQAPCSVHFIDVGQGDCILILADGEAALIDAGEKENAEKVSAYLKRMDVKQLDYVVATHPHADHIGALADLMKKIPVSHVILPKLNVSNTPTTKIYEDLLKAIKQSGAETLAAKPGTTFALGGASLTVLSPYQQAENLNNMSVILRVAYGDVSYLLAGDAEQALEKDILNNGGLVRANVLKVGHHGSDTSTSDDFLSAVAPQAAVISCGKDNDYGHPSAVTLTKLQKRGISLFRTDESGTIVIGTDGRELITALQKSEKQREAA